MRGSSFEGFMNFDTEIAAHINWKIRLNAFLNGLSSETFESGLVCRDNLCELGKWIYTEGKALERFPAYAELLKYHAHFHVCAAEVIKAFEAGNKAAAACLLEGDYALASRKTMLAIIRLKGAAQGIKFHSLPWKDEYNIGDETIDAQHQKMLALVADASTCLDVDHPQGTALFYEILPQVEAYAQTHFSTEEAMLKRCNYPKLDEQIEEHQRYMQWITAARQSSASIADKEMLHSFLSTWWRDHILNSDMQYKEYLAHSRQ